MDDRRHDAVIVMTDDISHGSNLTPRHARIPLQDLRGKRLDCFTDDEEVMKNRIERLHRQLRAYEHRPRAPVQSLGECRRVAPFRCGSQRHRIFQSLLPHFVAQERRSGGVDWATHDGPNISSEADERKDSVPFGVEIHE